MGRFSIHGQIYKHAWLKSNVVQIPGIKSDLKNGMGCSNYID